MKLIKSEEVVFPIKFRGKTILKPETKYTFDDDGAILTFAADPKKQWTFKLYDTESNEKGLTNAQTIISKFCRMVEDMVLQNTLTGQLD